MKYFTPDLLAQCRSLDPDIAEAAAAKWQERAEAYRKRLQEIQHRLPTGVKQLLRSTTLHDAFLLTMNFADVRGQPQFFLSFQLADRDDRQGVQLRYDLVKPLKVILHEPNTAGDTGLFALYDEFDIAGGTPKHSILMTAGVEIRVRFDKMHLTHLTRVVAPGSGRADIKQLAAMAGS